MQFFGLYIKAKCFFSRIVKKKKTKREKERILKMKMGRR